MTGDENVFILAAIPAIMDIVSAILIILGLSLFEIIISVDNAIINAEVLGTMSKKG